MFGWIVFIETHLLTLSLPLLYMSTTGFSGGAYREVFLSQLHEGDFVFKEYIWDSEYGKDDFEFMRMDAIVAEKLTWSSRIVDVYAFCALGMINEAMQNGDMEPIAVPSGNGRSTSFEAPEKSVKLKVENKLTGSQKLRYAWEMAEVSGKDIILVVNRNVAHHDISLLTFTSSFTGCPPHAFVP